MKTTLLLLALTGLSASAAITIGGTSVTNARNSLGVNIPTGSLALLIVDDAANGFFNFGTTPAAATTYTSASDPLVTPSLAGLSVGQTFGGELILARISTGAGSISGLLTNFTAAPYLNRQFAVVWFDGLTAAGTETTAASGSKWGVVRGSDWVFPAADSGTFTSSSSDANGAASFFQVNANAPAAGASAFRTTLSDVPLTGAASFTVVPEPSSAILGVIGALGFLRRRRN